MEPRRILKILETALENSFRLFKRHRTHLLPALQLAHQKNTHLKKIVDSENKKNSSFDSSSDETKEISKVSNSVVGSDLENDFAFIQTNYTVF